MKDRRNDDDYAETQVLDSADKITPGASSGEDVAALYEEYANAFDTGSTLKPAKHRRQQTR
jgi:hypothetical protein